MQIASELQLPIPKTPPAKCMGAEVSPAPVQSAHHGGESATIPVEVSPVIQPPSADNNMSGTYLQAAAERR